MSYWFARVKQFHIIWVIINWLCHQNNIKTFHPCSTTLLKDVYDMWDKDNQTLPIHFFAFSDASECDKCLHATSKYCEGIIHHVEMEKEAYLCVPRDAVSDVIRLTMPAKLKAMQHGLMAKIHGDKFLSFFPVPTKLLLHTLGEQLKSRQPAIREHEQLRVLEQCIHKKLGVNGISRPLSCKMSINLTVGTFEGIISSYIKDSWTQLLDSGIKSAVAPSMPQLPELAAMEAINSELETVQSEYLEFLSQILCHMSFPWLEAAKVKRSKTLVKKLIPLLESYKACHKLLGTDAAWKIRQDLIKILSTLVKKGGEASGYGMICCSSSCINVTTTRSSKLYGLHSDELGLGFGGKVLQQCSEMAVHCLKAPSEPFKDLGALYPVDWQILWFMEKNEEQAEKDRATALEKEHQNAKVLQSAKIQRAYIVAERMRKSCCNSNDNIEQMAQHNVLCMQKLCEHLKAAVEGRDKKEVAQAYNRVINSGRILPPNTPLRNLTESEIGALDSVLCSPAAKLEEHIFLSMTAHTLLMLQLETMKSLPYDVMDRIDA
ncbi:hypothetical protein EDD15DRAFT_2201478 [Pisolithus albus]|nr:hypothetical protein EDD15DRAFT_2201478 [Pisolithus albus]